jgi:hypothetical protein
VCKGIFKINHNIDCTYNGKNFYEKIPCRSMIWRSGRTHAGSAGFEPLDRAEVADEILGCVSRGAEI